MAFTKNDGYSAQQKLFEVALRQSGRSSRKDALIITEAEANAFLSRHLEKSGLMLSPIAVRFTKGEIVVQGQTALRGLLKGPPFAQIAPYLPDKKLNEAVWVTVRGQIKIDGSGTSRQGSVEISDFALGKQQLSGVLLTVLMGPSGGGLLSGRCPRWWNRSRSGRTAHDHNPVRARIRTLLLAVWPLLCRQAPARGRRCARPGRIASGRRR